MLNLANLKAQVEAARAAFDAAKSARGVESVKIEIKAEMKGVMRGYLYGPHIGRVADENTLAAYASSVGAMQAVCAEHGCTVSDARIVQSGEILHNGKSRSIAGRLAVQIDVPCIVGVSGAETINKALRPSGNPTDLPCKNAPQGCTSPTWRGNGNLLSHFAVEWADELRKNGVQMKGKEGELSRFAIITSPEYQYSEGDEEACELNYSGTFAYQDGAGNAVKIA